MANGDYTINSYFPDGQLLRRSHSTRTIRTTTQVTAAGDTIIKSRPWTETTIKSYYGNFEHNSQSNKNIYHTEQGYYDFSTGRHYWYQRDRLGSTVAVYDADGGILQTTGYYPSGTPYQLPNSAIGTRVDAATDRLHIGNRWLTHSGFNYIMLCCFDFHGDRGLVKLDTKLGGIGMIVYI